MNMVCRTNNQKTFDSAVAPWRRDREGATQKFFAAFFKKADLAFRALPTRQGGSLPWPSTKTQPADFLLEPMPDRNA